jgi:virginiamycin B lyase
MRDVRARVLCALALALSLTGGVGCGGDAQSDAQATDGPADLKLPRGGYPSDLVFSEDGSLWITGSGDEAVGRLRPSGKLEQYRLPGSENSPGDIVEGPDGGIWIAGFEQYIRIDPKDDSIRIGASFGPYGDLSVGLPRAIAPGPDGAVWYIDDGSPPALNRVSPSGSLSAIVPVPEEYADLSIESIALGPDGALWVTQSAEGIGTRRDGIGRMAVNGEFEHWQLPRQQSDPMQIVTGPDGALWFTERAGYRIGRITTAGEISEFPLRPGLAPIGIAAAPDGALWFTTPKRVGRITVSGEVATWPVPGADYLYNVAVAENGDVWITDGPARLVHHLDPPL